MISSSPPISLTEVPLSSETGEGSEGCVPFVPHAAKATIHTAAASTVTILEAFLYRITFRIRSLMLLSPKASGLARENR